MGGRVTVEYCWRMILVDNSDFFEHGLPDPLLFGTFKTERNIPLVAESLIANFLLFSLDAVYLKPRHQLQLISSIEPDNNAPNHRYRVHTE